jgi:hypothetical protein
MTTKKIIKQIAKKDGATEKQVEKDMKEAISIAMKSPNPEAQRFWKQVSPNGKEPSVEEFIRAITLEVLKRTQK